MAYGSYSEVYLAIQWSWQSNCPLSLNYDNRGFGIKVGETVNCRQRQNSLDFKITNWTEVGGDKEDRLFIESYLRKKISKVTGLNYFNGTDRFWFRNYKSIQYCQDNFLKWVKEARAILQLM